MNIYEEDKRCNEGTAEVSVSDIRASTRNHLAFDGNKGPHSDMITVEIDLTDPEDLIKKLSIIDLTDSETEMLLDKAHELNSWLRKQLLDEQHTSSTVVDSELRGAKSADLSSLRSSAYLVSAPAISANRSSKSAKPASRSSRVLPPLLRQSGNTDPSKSFVGIYKTWQPRDRSYQSLSYQKLSNGLEPRSSLDAKTAVPGLFASTSDQRTSQQQQQLAEKRKGGSDQH